MIFPHTMDSTMLAAFRSCHRKFYLAYMQHWKPKDESVDLVAGGAFAAGIERARKAFFIELLSQEDSYAEGLKVLMEKYGDFECPADSAKSFERTAGALEYYFDQFPLGADGMRPIIIGKNTQGIELGFAEPLDFIHPYSGNPILYTGRSDCLAEFGGSVFVFDEKTTKQLGPSWSRQWELRSQFTGYCWASKRMGIRAFGVVVRGIAILKTMYNNAQAITYREDSEIDRWYFQVHKDLEALRRCWDDDYWDYNFDHACGEYGGCQFAQVCKSETPEVWLEMYFEKRVWDPLLRKPITVEEYEEQWGGV